MSNEIHTRFRRYASRQKKKREKYERLFASRKITRNEIEEINGYLFLSIVAKFESFLEFLFIHLLLKKTRNSSRYVEFNSQKKAHQIISGGFDKYQKWLPITDTIDRANIYFKDGKPFNRLDKREFKGVLTEVSRIRNAIAHNSKHSLVQFRKKVCKDLALLPNETLPCGFLRHKYTTSPPTTKFEFYTDWLCYFAKRLE